MFQTNQEESHTDLRGENEKSKKYNLLILLQLKQQPNKEHKTRP